MTRIVPRTKIAKFSESTGAVPALLPFKSKRPPFSMERIVRGKMSEIRINPGLGHVYLTNQRLINIMVLQNYLRTLAAPKDMYLRLAAFDC